MKQIFEQLKSPTYILHVLKVALCISCISFGTVWLGWMWIVGL